MLVSRPGGSGKVKIRRFNQDERSRLHYENTRRGDTQRKARLCVAETRQHPPNDDCQYPAFLIGTFAQSLSKSQRADSSSVARYKTESAYAVG